MHVPLQHGEISPTPIKYLRTENTLTIDKMNITLPTTKTKATRRDPKFLLLYGPPKIGKTTILSKLENNLILDLEGGTEYLDALKLRVSSLEEFSFFCEKVKTTNPRPYKYISIDTIDVLEEWAEKQATMNYKCSPQGKNFYGESVLTLPMGGGYLWLREAFKDALQLTYPLAHTVIFVGHIRDKLLESQGKEVSSKDLDLTGKCKNIICSLCDAIGYLARDSKGNIGINFKTTETITCGSRCSHLLGQSFWFEGSNFDWNKIFIDEDSPEQLKAISS